MAFDEAIVSTCAEGAGRWGRDQARHYAILIRVMAILSALIRR